MVPYTEIQRVPVKTFAFLLLNGENRVRIEQGYAELRSVKEEWYISFPVCVKPRGKLDRAQTALEEI